MTSIKIYKSRLKITLSILIIIFFSLSILGCDIQKDENDISGSIEGYEIIGACKTPGFSKKVFVSGQYAYVTDDKWGVEIININDKSNPWINKTVKTGWAMDFIVSSDHGYVADYADGLVVIGLEEKDDPKIISKDNLLIEATSIYREGNFIYITDHQNELLIFDIENPEVPVLVGKCEELGWLYDIHIDRGFGYALFRSEDGSENGLKIINISNKKSPRLVGSWITNNVINSVFVREDYAYIAGGQGELMIVDISDKKNPFIASNIKTEDYASDVFIKGDHAYVTDGKKGLKKIDINNNNNPYIVRNWDIPHYSSGVFVEGDYIYIANYEGLMILEDA